MSDTSVAKESVLSRKDFLKYCGGVSAAGLMPKDMHARAAVPPRPHGAVRIKDYLNQEIGSWCHCEECEEWDDALQSRVKKSVAQLMKLFWESIRSEYGLTGKVPKWAGQGDNSYLIEEQVFDWVTEHNIIET